GRWCCGCCGRRPQAAVFDVRPPQAVFHFLRIKPVTRLTEALERAKADGAKSNKASTSPAPTEIARVPRTWRFDDEDDPAPIAVEPDSFAAVEDTLAAAESSHTE